MKWFVSLILLVSPVFNVEISEAVCCFVIFKKKKIGKVKSSNVIVPKLLGQTTT